MDTTTIVLLALLGIETVALVTVAVLYRKTKKAQKKRRVEAPNSAYKSQYVRDLEAKERWESVDLERLHEVNREEFQKILEKVRATSVRALTSKERAFLDRMAEAHDRVVAESREGGPGKTPRQARQVPGTS